MKAMILAAGVGSRLDPLTRNVPKPLVPILNRPVMEYLVELLKRHGFNEIMVNLHYLGEHIEQYFGDGSRWGVKIFWSHEDQLWGDAGSLKRVEDFFKDDTFIVIGGDDLTDMDLTKLVKTHKEKNALATIALSLVDDPSEYITRARSAASIGGTSAARAFSSACAGVFAPATTDAMRGSSSTNRRAACANVRSPPRRRKSRRAAVSVMAAMYARGRSARMSPGPNVESGAYFPDKKPFASGSRASTPTPRFCASGSKSAPAP